MIKGKLAKQLKIYQATAIFSVLFALVGFSYNVWRMEASEHNNNARTACFEMLQELAELEQIVYLAFYDQDPNGGNPRKGWTKVILVKDLSLIASPQIIAESEKLANTWQSNWQHIHNSQSAVDNIIEGMESLRGEIKALLISLN